MDTAVGMTEHERAVLLTVLGHMRQVSREAKTWGLLLKCDGAGAIHVKRERSEELSVIPLPLACGRV